MNTSESSKAKYLKFNNEFMDVYLMDGRVLRIPLDWYPRLEWATPKQRKNYELIYDGEAMHWPDVDEDISVAGLLRGNKAPRTKPYLTGKWSPKLEKELKRIEASYRAKPPIPGKRTKPPIAKSMRRETAKA